MLYASPNPAGRVALETFVAHADTYGVIARLPTPFRATDVDTTVGKLTDCDESLSLIAADMEELAEEIGRLRAGAAPLMESLAERDARLAEQEGTLSKLETERLLALRSADDAAAALHEARDRLHEHDGRVTKANLELEELRSAIAERDRQLAHTERELAVMGQALAEREAALLQERAPLAELVNLRDTRLAETGQAVDALAGHVRFVPFPEGYRLVDSEERCAMPGDRLELERRTFVVARVGRSPFPADERPCAYLLLSGAAE